MKKYNPPYENIIGQEKVVKILTQVVEKNQVSHGYIFSGPEGTQKKEMAYGLAKALLSKGQTASSENIAKKIHENNHPDIIDIIPDGASIKIQQIRRLRQDISIRPLEAHYKIYIIHKADTMGAPAQNALLKTLEEPPEYGVIILLTNNVSALLPTILSRSQQLNFQRVDSKAIEEYLTHHMDLPKDRARNIASIVNGSIEKANHLIQEEDILKERRELLESILRIIKGDTILAFHKAQWFKDNKEDVENWLDFLTIWFRDIALYKELGHTSWIVYKEFEDYLENFSEILSTEQIHVIIEEISKSKYNMKYNVNLQLNIETMLLKMQED